MNRRDIIVALSAATVALSLPAAASAPKIRHHGAVVRVDDLGRAIEFYCGGLGFGLADFRPTRRWARLTSNIPIYLEEVPGSKPPDARLAHSGIVFLTRDLGFAQQLIRSAHGRILGDGPYQTAVGTAVRFTDTGGVVGVMLESNPKAVSEPRVFNTGFALPSDSVAGARALFERALGFQAATDRFFPPSVPFLEQDGGFGFMVHQNEHGQPEWKPGATDLHTRTTSVVFAVEAIGQATRAATTGGASLLQDASAFEHGRRSRMAIPGGAEIEFWEFS